MPCSTRFGGFMISAALKWVSKFEESAIALLFAFNLLILFVTVVYRYILDNSPTWPEEASRYVMIWIIYIGVSQSVEKNSEIKIDVLSRFFPDRIFTKFTEYFALSICIAVSALICYYGIEFTKVLMQTQTTAASFPMSMSLIYSVIPATGFLMIIKYLKRLIDFIKT